jgi:Na+-transporting methylmalonyl-CoA/oxaloacetate decarboxylase beta subunit
MPAWKLIVAYLGWLLASAAIALLFGLVLGELLALAGVVDSSSTAQRRVVEIAATTWFLIFGLLPFLLKKRIVRREDHEDS